MKKTNLLLNRIIKNGEAENFAVSVGQGEQTFFDIFASQNKVDAYTKFDMASVTKVMATTTIALIALDKGLIHLNSSISEFLPCPDNRREITVKNLLTHTLGIGHKNMCAEGYSYENITDYILKIPLDKPIGSEVLYSCPGFVVLGRILETVFGKRLDVLFEELVAAPLELRYSGFLPQDGSFVNSGMSDSDSGLVNDYNCRYLGGVAGNAGLFSNLEDVKKYISFLLKRGAPLISEETFAAAVLSYTDGMVEARGLGFMLVNERYRQTGELFPIGSIGHCGHTGQSVFVDLKSGLWAVILSDMTISTAKKFGQENYDIVMKNRELIHNAILEDLKDTPLLLNL